jgi:predicted tellurium resistance membrane protein TerC
MEIFTLDNSIALLSLTALEIVLGIDNIVFIAILVGKLPENERASVRRLGLFLAMFMRIALLLALSWVMGLKEPIFSVVGKEFSGRDLILILGGLFLVGKATYEIHDKVEGDSGVVGERKDFQRRTRWLVIFQILLLDLVFSLDSVITAVGMANALWVMIVAVIIAVVVMLVFAGRISGFIERHPSLKMLALSFLVLIGVMLLAEGFGQHIDKGYIYFAMVFSLLVETLNIRASKKRKLQAAHAAATGL